MVTTWYPSDAATESGIFVQRDVQLLARGNDVTVLHLVTPRLQRSPSTTVEDGVTVRRFPMSTTNPTDILRASRLIGRLLGDVDLVHTMALSALLPFALLRVRIPWVHTEHWSGIVAPETTPLAMRLTLPLSTRLLSKPDVVVAVSEYLAEHIRPRRRGPVVVIPNFVMMPDVVSPRPAGSGLLRLVAVGGLIPRKGPDLAIAAVAELRNRGVQAHLRWIGDGPMRNDLEATVRQDRLDDAVTFDGVQPPDTVAAALAASDLFVLPTMNETFGVSIAEALASGRAVVVGATGGQSEFVTPENGEIVSGRDPVAYADAIEAAVRADAGRTPERIAATVRERFSETRRGDAYAAAYARARPGSGAGDVDVDVIIAVHDPRRPIERAVASVLDRNASRLRVTVVVHNTAVDPIRERLSRFLSDPRLRILELSDGIRSPAGPFNAGLDAATAVFTSVMGSDDELEPGAIDAWLRVAEKDHAAVVIPRLRHAGGANVPTPPARPLRRSGLDGVKDRLPYRSAPLGLVSRHRFGDERFTAGLQTGEDISYVTALWFSGERISFDLNGPAYVIQADAVDRVSFSVKPVRQDLEFLRPLLDDPRWGSLRSAQRLALAVKLLRIHIFGAVTNRPDPTSWTAEDRRELAEATERCLALDPGALHVLSRSDARVVEAIRDVGVPSARLIALGKARRRFARPASVFPARLRSVLAREAPLRMMVASVLVRAAR